MATKEQRLELRIDVLDKENQRAQALPGLMPSKLIEAILQEFRGDLDYLGTTVDDYDLQVAASQSPLDYQKPLSEQLDEGERLTLIERTVPIPVGAQRLAQRVYLREQISGKVFKLNWVPAIIGRADRSLNDEHLLAVDLGELLRGSRVSRRHAQIVEDHGQLFLEVLADNPTYLRREELTTEVGHERTALQAGDVIIFERSAIALQVIIKG